eukprot:9483414-Pyramimonas_sp.AAC.1
MAGAWCRAPRPGGWLPKEEHHIVEHHSVPTDGWTHKCQGGEDAQWISECIARGRGGSITCRSGRFGRRSVSVTSAPTRANTTPTKPHPAPSSMQRLPLKALADFSIYFAITMLESHTVEANPSGPKGA